MRKRMGHAWQALLLLFFMCMPISYAQEFLQNPDFKIPPTNIITSNASSPILLQPGPNSIPGWSFNGTVWYLTRGALQLGRDGEINQTVGVIDKDINDYILSFTLAAQTQACIDHVSVNVSVYMGSDVQSMRQFFLQRNYSRNLWGRRALYLGQLFGRQTVDIHIIGDHVEEDNNVTNCWPVVDDFVVNKIDVYGAVAGPGYPTNGDFELGSALLNNFSEGIILTGEEDMYSSPLTRWSILGTIKYIHYNGNAAIELLSAAPSGIQKEFLDPPPTSTLSFTLGHGNDDTCVGDFVVYVEAGADKFNFTIRMGTSVNHSVTVTKLSSLLNVLRFYSLNETKTTDAVLCGPILDNIRLISHGERKHDLAGLLIFGLFFALMQLL